MIDKGIGRKLRRARNLVRKYQSEPAEVDGGLVKSIARKRYERAMALLVEYKLRS